MTRLSFFSFFLRGAISARLLPYAFLTLRPPGEPLPCSSSVKEEPVARKLGKPGPGAAALHGI